MNIYWLTFTDGSNGACSGLNPYDAKIIAEVDAAYEFADQASQPPPEARFENILVGE